MIHKTNFNMIVRVFSTLFFILCLSFSNVKAEQTGQEAFDSYCTACHSIGKGVVIGPDLAGISERRSEEWLLKWIPNSKSLIDAGDKDAIEVFQKFNKIPMPAQPLNADQVKSILKYISEYKPPVTTQAEGVTPTEVEEDSSFNIYLILAGLIVFFLIIINLISSINKRLEALLYEKKGLPIPEQTNFIETAKKWCNKNNKVVAFVIIVLLLIGMKDTWDTLMNIGVYEGYHPEQPIKYSHKIHAGINDIDCKYCHSGASKSKHAGVPSANVCMNCHKFITSGAETGEVEIKKIYEAIGFDPATRSYIEGAKQKPIQWIKVHNLPDHVYFNHSQHVTVGKVECITCHGDVKEMGTVKQFAPLTMGWCVNCHRETGVDNKGAYYEEIHNRMSKENKEKFLKDGKLTVSELGGLECGKCHY